MNILLSDMHGYSLPMIKVANTGCGTETNYW